MLVHAVIAPGSENSHVFSLGGLRWSQDQFIDESDSQTAQGMAAWETFDLKVIGGAGGTQQAPGDYFYGDLRRPFTQAGVWGLQRSACRRRWASRTSPAASSSWGRPRWRRRGPWWAEDSSPDRGPPARPGASSPVPSRSSCWRSPGGGCPPTCPHTVTPARRT